MIIVIMIIESNDDDGDVDDDNEYHHHCNTSELNYSTIFEINILNKQSHIYTCTCVIAIA